MTEQAGGKVDMNALDGHLIELEIAEVQARFDVRMKADVAVNHGRLIASFNHTKYHCTYAGQWKIEPDRSVKQK